MILSKPNMISEPKFSNILDIGHTKIVQEEMGMVLFNSLLEVDMDSQKGPSRLRVSFY